MEDTQRSIFPGIKISLVVITDGRLDYLRQTIASMREKLRYPFIEKIMVNDSTKFNDILLDEFPEFHVITHVDKKGLAGAVQTAWSSVNPEAQYIFHLEEDFIFNQQVPIDDMLFLLQRLPYLSQMILRRQPWSPEERDAGGFQYLYNDEYIEKEMLGFHWMETRKFFSLNPGLYRTYVTKLGWPDSNEAGFTALLNKDANHKSGILGKKSDPPMVEHIGYNRSNDWKE